MIRSVPILAVLVLAASAMPASAYIGPGAGLSAIGAAVAVVGAFLLLLVGFVWYPVKRLVHALRGRGETAETMAED